MSNRMLDLHYREIINAINEGIIVVGEDGTILMANSAMASLSGYPMEELVGSPCTVINCDACELILSQDKKHWCRLFEIGSIKGRRCLMMKKDGSYISVIENAAILKDKDGRLIGAVETFYSSEETDYKDQKIEELSNLINEDAGFHGIIGQSSPMLHLFQVIEKAAQSDAPVLITGESGTGKELVANAIHTAGIRNNGPFIKFNCAALNESLLESELFGHVRGAFTGAYRHRKGRFEAAHGGDIFLDEIGDMSLSTQSKLLRVLETKRFERLGDSRTISVDVRIICATNRNLLNQVTKKLFREDLFYRINVIPIHLPPLRDRKEDIILLVKTFIERLRIKSGKDISGITPELMNLFMQYNWPGNVRELKSSLEYAFVIAESGLIGNKHLPVHLFKNTQDLENNYVEHVPFLKEENSAEKNALIDALHLTKGNKTKAAKLLGVHRMTIWNRMRKYSIQMHKKIE